MFHLERFHDRDRLLQLHGVAFGHRDRDDHALQRRLDRYGAGRAFHNRCCGSRGGSGGAAGTALQIEHSERIVRINPRTGHLHLTLRGEVACAFGLLVEQCVDVLFDKTRVDRAVFERRRLQQRAEELRVAAGALDLEFGKRAPGLAQRGAKIRSVDDQLREQRVVVNACRIT